MRNRVTYIACTAVMILLSSRLCIAFQVNDSTYITEESLTENFLLHTKNPAHLIYTGLPSFSASSVFFNKQNGKLRNYYESSNSYTYGLDITSLKNFNKTSLYGKVGYEKFEGRDMQGSFFIDPDKTPFDAIELRPTASSTKGLETYQLIGGIAHKINEKWSMGGKIDYLSADFAKFRDLRHTNQLVDMTVGMGTSYQVLPRLNFGVGFMHNRRIETMALNTHGNQEREFVLLLGYGAFLGQPHRVTRNGTYFILGTSEPLVETQNGLSFQFRFLQNERLSFLGDLHYLKGSGYYGTPGDLRIKYSEHTRDIVRFNGQVLYQAGKNQYRLDYRLNYDKLNNIENIFREENGEDGNPIIVVLGTRNVLNKYSYAGQVGISAWLDVKNDIPKWIVGVSSFYNNRDQSIDLFPYAREQNLYTLGFQASVKKNVFFHQKLLESKISIGYASGGGEPFKDINSGSGSSNSTLTSYTELLMHEHDFITQQRYTGAINVKYQFRARKLFRPYAGLFAQIQYAPNAEYMGKSNFASQANIGLFF